MQYVVLLAMAVFFGFAFEQFYGSRVPRSPGGVRVFPILSFAGAALYLIEPLHAAAFIAGLAVLGAWLFVDVRYRSSIDEPGHGYLMVPVCTLGAYVLGAVALTQPTWFTVALTVAAVLLIGGRERLHAITERVPFEEVLTLGQFLLLVGVVLPLLYGAPAIPFTTITPLKVWLAVIAVSTISYVSYLLDRYVLRERGTLVSAILGGMYSSTATTIVLARYAAKSGYSRELASGTVAATAVMYVRLWVVCALFNFGLARLLALPVLALFVFAVAAAWLIGRFGPSSAPANISPENPLALGTALVFAILLIVFSQLSTWASAHLGAAGLLAVGAVVGFTDIDPFVLGVVESQTIALPLAAGAILVAASSNDVLKGAFAVIVSRRRESAIPVAALVALAAAGVGAAWMILR
jgi:uncharacterized membrane protein (DUF4010 family)